MKSPKQSVSQKLMSVGIVISVAFLLMAIATPLLQAMGVLTDPSEFLSNPIHQPPSPQHWFGTDLQGHDVFTRTIAGAGVAWQVTIASTVISLVIGVPLGMLSGYKGGWLGVWNAAIALSVAYIPQYFRVIRNQTVSTKTEVYIEAAQAIGADTKTILIKYLAPNVIQSLPVIFALNAADAILTLAGLGFLGLGIPEDVPEWGHDLKQALDALSTGENIWWTTIFPGLAITLMTIGLSLVGEGLTQRFSSKKEQ